MDIQAFIQQSCGRWFTQRTCHQMGNLSSEAQSAQLWMEQLSLEDRAVLELCNAAEVDLAVAQCAAKISWKEQGFQVQPQETGELLLVALSNTPHQGEILQQVGSAPLMRLNFQIDGDQKLILTGTQDQFHLEERVWFASPNLRLRISLLKQANQLYQATWYSEVRMGVLPEPAPEELPHAASTK